MADADNFLNKIISGDQTWCFAYDPETRRQISEPAGETYSPPKNCNSKGSASRLYRYFFYSQGAMHKQFVPEGKTVNAIFYKGVMDRLLKRIQRVPSAVFFSRDFFLLLQNAPAHEAEIFDPPKCYNPLSLAHSPDLSLPGCFLFSRLKENLKGVQFADAAEIQEAVGDELNMAQKEKFSAAFKKLYDRTKAYIC
jgi:hypothetical protein